MSTEITPGQFVDLRRFHTDKVTNGANMFNGALTVRLDPKPDEIGVGYGCCIYSALNAGDLLGTRPDQHRSRYLGYELGFDPQLGFPVANMATLFEHHELRAPYYDHITDLQMYNHITNGGIVSALIWEPEWYLLETADDQGHSLLIAGLDDPRQRGDKAQALIIDCTHPQADDFTYTAWTIALPDLDKIWWDAAYPFDVMANGQYARSPEWYHRSGHLIAPNGTKG